MPSSLDDSLDARHPPTARAQLRERYLAGRALSEQLAAPLSAEDQCLQGMPDASPTKWHLAHTTWFFEIMVLGAGGAAYRPFDPSFAYLFNSYYESLGPRQPRPQRGMISRPGLEQVMAYRSHVDRAMQAYIETCGDSAWAAAACLIELGVQHEQQHQELILSDIKYGLSLNPYDPAYKPRHFAPAAPPPASAWLEFPGGETTVGHRGGGFCYDNEAPRHRVLLPPYRLANRLTTCGDYLAFMADDAYRRPELWLSDGWAAIAANGWQAPLYWRQERNGEWSVFTLHGRRPLDPAEPLCHISFYEAAAYAEWAQARLPTEFEWEAAVADLPIDGNFLDLDVLHPRAAGSNRQFHQAYGDVWVWTRSSYDPYPGFRPLPGTASEYNGKFMVGQLVLRGGSCASPPGHLRPSYRNFFPPAARWQFSGLRLARDA